MDKAIWIILVLMAGMFLPLQAGLNAKLGKAASNPIYGSTISFIVGTIVLLSYVIISKQPLSFSGLKLTPAYYWLGGLLGAFYLTISIYGFTKLEPGLTFGLVVTGQVAISLILEHFHVLVVERHPISLVRILGLLLIIIGVVLIKKF